MNNDHHDHTKPTYSFKHDTSNLAIFVILIFCVADLMATLAVTRLVFHKLRDDEKIMKSVPSKELADLRSQEQAILEGMEAHIQAVVGDYSK